MRPIKDIEEIAKPNSDCNMDLIDILGGKPESALRMDAKNEYVIAQEWKKESEQKTTKQRGKEMER